MIVSFRHKGLKLFYETGSKRGIQPAHALRLTAILTLLDAAAIPEGTMLAQYKTHALQGDRRGFYSMWVSGNWRVTFRFLERNVELVNYEDYH